MDSPDSFLVTGSSRIRLHAAIVFVLFLILFLPWPVWSQSRIAGTIDDTRLVTLPGNTHSLAQPAFDRGAVSGDFPADRMTLVLKRSADQGKSLQAFLGQVQNPASPIYHQYLTPAQVGQQYGVSQSDLEAVTGWLSAAGFSVNRVHSGRMAIEFSGSASQVESAFHTTLHRYVVNGEQHYANANDPEIPAALARVVGGITLNNFAPRPLNKSIGRAQLDAATHRATPLYNDPSPNTIGCLNNYCFAVVPGDFATIYDTKPLLASGIDGAGVSIGIVGDVGIDTSLVQLFRQNFLPAYSATNLPNEILDGPEPTVFGSGDEIEAYLDVEVAGGVAPNATINYYYASNNYFTDGLALAMARALDDNQVSILSVSFGECEAYLGASGNQLYNNFYEQAAAQGITVMAATGDSGPAGCDPPPGSTGVGAAEYGFFVSGLASTPYNVAVGGTDFYYPADATMATLSTYWQTATASNPNNNADWSSALSYIPEKPWDLGDPVLDQVSFSPSLNAGGGGPSSCIDYTGPPPPPDGNGPLAADCQEGGYPKPAWQSGFGDDTARDLPDVSLFASNESNYSFTAICAFAPACSIPNDGPNSAAFPLPIDGVGGTSVAAPAMAGIMALVVEKTQSRQGQANTVLYPLSQQVPQAFHDIAVGTNAVSCVAGSPDCAAANYLGYLTGYNATVGYDMATGLGSIDAAQLVNNWSSVTFKPTATTLTITPTTAAHSTPLTFTVNVTGGPTSGEITLPTTHSSGEPYATTCAAFPCTFTYAGLPGGSYDVSARYEGSSVYAPSTSNAVPVTISPENSEVAIYYEFCGYLLCNINGQTDLPYDQVISFYAVPVPANYALPVDPASIQSTPATGTVTITDFGAPVGAPITLETGQAYFGDYNLPVGKHSLVASYSGDSSYNPSNTVSPLATPLNFTIGPGPTLVQINPYRQDVLPGSPATVSVSITDGGAVAPTGRVTVSVSSATGANTVLPPVPMSYSAAVGGSVGVVTIPAMALASGSNFATATYSGDANYLPETTNGLNAQINVTTTQSMTYSSLATTPPAPVVGQQVQIVATVISAVSNAEGYPTGSVTFLDGTNTLGTAATVPNPNGDLGDAIATFTTSTLTTGVQTLTANYGGDVQDLASTASIQVTVAPLDFTVTGTPVTLASGASNPSANSTLTFTLNSVSSGASTFTLSCAATKQAIAISCAVPASVSIAAGATTTTSTATVSITGVTARLEPVRRLRGGWWPVAGSFALALLLPIGFGRGRRGRRAFLSALLLMALAAGLSSCGGIRPSTVPPGSYSVTVTATLGSDSHQTSILVTVELD
ncbi:MAG: Ig-like domain repeat protein [Terracidiphilus sp.]